MLLFHLLRVRHARPVLIGCLYQVAAQEVGEAIRLMYSAYPRLKTPVIGMLAVIYPTVAIVVDGSVMRIL